MSSPESLAARIKRHLIRRILQLAVFLVFYVLSIGPMYWYWYEAKYLGSSRMIIAFYEPLRQACRIPIVNDIVHEYISWWAV